MSWGDIVMGAVCFYLGKKDGEKKVMDDLKEHIQNTEIENLRRQVTELQRQVNYQNDKK